LEQRLRLLGVRVGGLSRPGDATPSAAAPQAPQAGSNAVLF